MTTKEVDDNIITASLDGEEAGTLPIAVPVAIAVAIPNSYEEAQAIVIYFFFQLIDMLLLLVGLQLPMMHSLPF